MIQRVIYVSLVTAISNVAPAIGQAIDTGSLQGRVVHASTRLPIAGAVLDLGDTGLTARTDTLGVFRFPRVTPGVYRLTARAIGFQPLVVTDIVVGSAKQVEIVVPLAPGAITLEEIEVRPSYFRTPTGLAGGETLSAEETRRAPGVQEDILRSVALFPGVGITTGGRNDLIVRGGAPFENLFLVDGIAVPNINHFGSQGSTGGPLSLINVDFVQEAVFSSGGFSPKYGDRTASVTSITLREGNRSDWGGEVNLSATGFGAMAEGPIGRSASAWLGVRRSYLDLLFKAAGFSFIPAYWDFQGKATAQLDPANQLSVLAIGAINTVAFDNSDADDRFDNSRIMAPEQRQYFAGITWRHFLTDGLLTVTLGRTFTRFETLQRDSLNPPQVVFRNLSTEGDNSLRTDLVWTPSDHLEVNIGTESHLASTLRYEIDLPGEVRRDADGVPRPLAVDTSMTAFRSSAYAEVVTRPLASLRLSAGLRANYYGFLHHRWRVAPRLGVRAAVDANTALTGSLGIYYQAPSYIWLTGDSLNGDRLRPIVSEQAVVGVERELRPDLKVRLEGFYKRYRDYPARRFRPQAVLAPSGFEDATLDIPFGLEPLESVGRGRVVGVEMLVQKRFSDIPVYGLASFTLSRADFEGLDGIRRPGAFDTRAIANVLLGYRPNPAWELSGKVRVATGLPTTPFIPTGSRAGQLDFVSYNAGPRLPTFHALDLRVDRRWSLRAVQITTYVDVQNVYGRSNTTQIQWNARLGTPEPNESLGVLPSLGVNIEF